MTADVEEIVGRRGYLVLKMRAEGKTFKEIGEHFGVCRQQAWNICNRAKERLEGGKKK